MLRPAKPILRAMQAFPVMAVLACVAAAGCGDALLPSDFSGPPAAAVTGNVLVPDPSGYTEAERPRLHIEWLTTLDDTKGRNTGGDHPATALVGQAVSFQRSQQLRNDWDIGFSVPSEAVKLDLDLGMRPFSLAVGKMVYFDDRVPDGRLDWACRGDHCDRVMAISNEFVVYVDRPLFCEPEAGKTVGRATQRLAAGYHYFDLDGALPIGLDAGGSLNFLFEDTSPADSDPTDTLRAFTALLVFSIRFDILQGC